MGKIESLVIGRDGQVRGARLRVSSKTGRNTIIQRPLQKLINLEISEPVSDEQVDKHGERHIESRRLTWRAAQNGQVLRRLKTKFYDF